jgi:membrane peptidoglycan carboxypeptidase
MTDMATAFGVFANGGYRVNLHPILQVTDNQGHILEQYIPPSSPIFGTYVLSPGVAYIMTQMLMDNNARLLEFGPTSALKIGKQHVAVKTGTTNDFRDNWTIGYTISPSYLVAIWVGNNDHTAMSGIASGITGAAPIWNAIMSHLLEDKKTSLPTEPSDVIGKIVCSPSGLLVPANPDPGCASRYEYFVKGTEPRQVDPGKQGAWIDKTTNDLAKPGQTDNIEARQQIVITDPTGDRYCLDCPHPSPSPTSTPGH